MSDIESMDTESENELLELVDDLEGTVSNDESAFEWSLQDCLSDISNRTGPVIGREY